MNLKQAIQKSYPKASINGAVGRGTSFEVTVTNSKGEKQLIHSKLDKSEGFVTEANIDTFMANLKKFVEN